MPPATLERLQVCFKATQSHRLTCNLGAILRHQSTYEAGFWEEIRVPRENHEKNMQTPQGPSWDYNQGLLTVNSHLLITEEKLFFQ